MVLSVYNHKGGTGKTTTTINVGQALCDAGYRVLLVDLDAQANLSYSLGVLKDDHTEVSLSPLSVVKLDNGMHMLPNNTAPDFLVDYQFHAPFQLREELSTFFKEYDFVLIDCPPAMTMTVVNALMASDGVIIPTLADVLSLEGLRQVIQAINKLTKSNNHQLEIVGVVPVMVDGRRQLTREVLDIIKNTYDIPVFESVVRMNVKTAEAPSFGASVVAYAPESNGARDYRSVTNELINQINK